MMAKRIFK